MGLINEKKGQKSRDTAPLRIQKEHLNLSLQGTMSRDFSAPLYFVRNSTLAPYELWQKNGGLNSRDTLPLMHIKDHY